MKLRTALLIVLACSFAAEVLPARAAVDVDLGASVRIGDRTNVFLSISSRYFEREPSVVTDWSRRFRDPDDLVVFFFLVQRSGKSPEAIYSLRKQGLSWWDVGLRVGVPNEVWFVPVEKDPGPPYGKAYGHWRRHRRNPSFRMAISDDDCRNLVSVRMVHDYYGIPAEVAMESRAGGRNVRSLVVDEYDNRHGMSGSVSKRGHGKKPHSGQGHDQH